MFQTPILFLIFNRPDHTRIIFEAIKAIKPAQLFIAADGPRQSVFEDIENCKKAREVIHQIDWDCDLKILFRDENLKCRYAVSSAINWFFDQVEEGIILEDDTLPDISFFTFCEELLIRYRDNERIRHVNGTNWLLGKNFTGSDSYYFSNYCHPWGWATWKRAWKDFDVHLAGFDESKLRNRLNQFTEKSEVVEFWINNLKATDSKEIDSWDYQWFYALWMNNGLAATSAVNLITNIGFGENATNTKYIHTRIGNMKRGSLKTIHHPVEIAVNGRADDYAMQTRLKEGRSNLFEKVQAKMALLLSSQKNAPKL
ncbi:MAG: nucleotide-diphospho-sugar transferase [Bacteroidota bacterium]